jgi:hypothetical protein
MSIDDLRSVQSGTATREDEAFEDAVQRKMIVQNRVLHQIIQGRRMVVAKVPKGSGKAPASILPGVPDAMRLWGFFCEP